MLRIQPRRLVALWPAVFLTFFPLVAQDQTVPLQNWAAPLYWQPPAAEESLKAAATEPRLAAGATPPLVFVGMTPCRVMDTRSGQGQVGPFGPPFIAGGATRTVPIPLHPTCGVPPTAMAYSFNVTAVPMGPLYYLTIWPTGQPQPGVSTLNSFSGAIVANAAVVPAGLGSSVDIYVTQNANVIVDINGYYMRPTALALWAGTAGAPSLTFSNDANSGMYSSAPGVVRVTSAGTDILTVNSSGITVGGSTGSVTANWGSFDTSGANHYAVRGHSGGTGLTKGVYGGVNSTIGTGGYFYNSAVTGKALSGYVNGTEVFNADEKGVHAGPGMTGTAFAYGVFSTSATKMGGSANISCTWQALASQYDCTLTDRAGTPVSYNWSDFVAVATPLSESLTLRTGSTADGKLALLFRNNAGILVQSYFSVVVYKP